MLSFSRAAPLLLALSLGACASPIMPASDLPHEPGESLTLNTNPNAVQCAPYAREHSSVNIHGDAWTWWDQAAGRFNRAPTPQEGAVMVLNDYAGPKRGHVAVVRRQVSSREIRVDHANWLSDGSIFLNNPVADVSADNDWSVVKVWNIKTGAWGIRTYPVTGFISAGPLLLARNGE